MIFYYSVYSFLLLIGRAAKRGAVYWFVLFFLIIIAGFRYEVGCDWGGYLNNWYIMKGHSVADALETRNPAHWSIIALLQDLGLSYTWLLATASAIFFFGFNSLARRQPNPLSMLVLAFPVLIIGMPMSGIRQAEAIGVMCFAFNAFVDRKLIRYLFFVGVAVLFHESAMVFVALAPFIPFGFTRKNIISAVVLALPGLYLMTQSSAADLATDRYVNSGVDAAGSAFRLLVLVMSGAAYLLKIRPHWRRQFPEDYKLVTISAWLMVVAFSLFFVSSVIGDRFGYYLIPLQLVIFTRIPYLQGLRNRQLWTVAPYALLTTVFLVWTQLSWHFQQCYVPYQFGIYSDS
ncbi:MAG: EpsG family protein [Rhodobacteraceae bacterium]|nr:MAG: EpsG family protein [Paracoccaceae bacterium]